MATESETTWDGFLKILYQPGNMTESLRDNFMFYNWLMSFGNVVPYGGDHIQFSVKSKRQAGIGFVASGASTLPTATTSAAFKPQFGVAWTYGIGELDDMVMKISRNQTMAYQQAQDQVVDDLLVSMKMILNACWYGDGRCILAELPGQDDEQTITVLQPNHIMNGFIVDLVDVTDNSTLLLDAAPITAVDHQGITTNLLQSTVTTSAAAPSGSAVGDYFTPAGAIVGGAQLGPHGIQSGCSASDPPLESYGTIAVASQPEWKGNEINNGGVNVPWKIRKANALLQLILRRSSTALSLGDIRIINNRNITQEIFEQVAPDRQIVTRGREALTVVPGYDGGSDSAGFEPWAYLNGVNPMYQDEMAPANKQFFLAPKTWHCTQTNPPELDQDDGNVLHRFESRPAKQFRWRFPHQVYTHARTANGLYDDIAETNPLA